MKTFLTILLIVIISHSNSSAGISGANSIEWLTCASEIVVVGKITSITNKKEIGDVVYADCTIEVSKLIKGPPRKQFYFCYRYLYNTDYWQPPKSEVLIFLCRHTSNYDEHRLQYYSDPYYEARLHGLLMPTENSCPGSIIDLAAPEKFIFNRKLKQLTEKKAIINTAMLAASSHAKKRLADPKFTFKPYRIDVPFDTEAYKILYAGSGCYIQVPDFLSVKQTEKKRPNKKSQKPNR